MKKTISLLIAALITCSTALAHEGMWLLNMKTPKKKSKWQARLEELQKQQQQARRR